MDKYLVIELFEDDLDGKRLYRVGDVYPREGLVPTEARIKQLMGLNKYGKTFLQKYTVGTGVGGAPRPLNLETEMAVVRGPFDTVEDRLEADRESTKGWLNNNIMTQSEFDSWVATLLDGGPSIFLDSLAMLQSTYPQGAAGVALVRETDPAKLYAWHNGTWEFITTYVPGEIKDNSLGIEKLDFIEESINKFDYKKLTIGYHLNPNNGTLIPFENLRTSDFIDMKHYTKIIIGVSRRVAFFNSNKQFVITDTNMDPSVNTVYNRPPGTQYFRFDYSKGDQSITDETQKANLGDQHLPFEPYYKWIPSSAIQIKPIATEDIEPSAVTPVKTDFIGNSGNLFSITQATKGVYASHENGSVLVNPDYYLSGPILLNGIAIANRDIRTIAYYDEKYNFISGEQNLKKMVPFAMPESTYIIRVSVSKVLVSGFKLCKGTKMLATNTYGLPIEESIVPLRSRPLTHSIPPVIYGVVGKELSVYFKNIVDNDALLNFNVVGTLGRQMTNKWTTTPTEYFVGSMTFEIFDGYTKVDSASPTIVARPIAIKDLTVLVIGDSTVNANYMTQSLLDLYAQEESNLTLLGTRGSGLNRSEGRGGWGAKTYRTATEAYGSPNPFYNSVKGDFDFSYYILNQGYQTPNHVVIQLGINDTFGFTDDVSLINGISQILSDLDYLISDIKTYDSAIKVGIVLTIPPNNNQDAFGNAYGNGQTKWRYKRNNVIWVNSLIDHYGFRESERIYLIPMQHNIDTGKNIADGVHPTVDGYGQMGDSLYAYLKNIG